jgi:hypothetical protein
LPDALVYNGCGADQLSLADARSIDDVRRAYDEQLDAVQRIGGRIVVMASRALARIAGGPEDYATVYDHVLQQCEQPAIVHWLGEMFDPALRGYWGRASVDEAIEVCLAVIAENAAKVDGIKVSLLDKEKEIAIRRRLPAGVNMYTGDDFNYPELIERQGLFACASRHFRSVGAGGGVRLGLPRRRRCRRLPAHPRSNDTARAHNVSRRPFTTRSALSSSPG